MTFVTQSHYNKHISSFNIIVQYHRSVIVVVSHLCWFALTVLALTGFALVELALTWQGFDARWLWRRCIPRLTPPFILTFCF